MKQLLLLLLVTTTLVTAQTTSTTSTAFSERYISELRGTYISGSGELLIIRVDNSFVRFDDRGILAQGKLSLINNEIHVIRTDIEEDYNLVYGLTGDTLVITQPNSIRAWLWTRIK